MTNHRTIPIICFGEVLWDIFPKGRKPGGAPLNVAYHLKRLGISSSIISRVGGDEPGRELLQLMREWEVDSGYCQIDYCHATGSVLASMDDAYEVSYDIVFPVAWDFIQWEERYKEEVAAADAFVFGSLIMRNDVSEKTLQKLLSVARYRVFDVNLRPPHYNSAQVLSILKDTDLLKLNQSELDIIGGWTGNKLKTEEDSIRFIQDTYGIDEILLTKGENGAAYYKENERYSCPAYSVKVVDTVGSGDAFLAAFLEGRLSEREVTIDRQLEAAAALGAFVASKSGACPAYDIADLEVFKQQNSVNIKRNQKLF